MLCSGLKLAHKISRSQVKFAHKISRSQVKFTHKIFVCRFLIVLYGIIIAYEDKKTSFISA